MISLTLILPRRELAACIPFAQAFINFCCFSLPGLGFLGFQFVEHVGSGMRITAAGKSQKATVKSLHNLK